MEEVIQITGICVVSALMALVVRKGNPEMALVLTLAAVVMVLLSLSDGVLQMVAFLQTLGEASGVSWSLFVPLMKTIGIALVVQVGGNLCRDAGESALATVVEVGGTICVLLVSVPLLQEVLEMLLELMR